MIIASDMSEPFFPLSEESLLVSYHESKTVIDSLVEKLPIMFQNNTPAGSCAGAALSSASQLVVSFVHFIFLNLKFCLALSSLYPQTETDFI